MTQEQLEELAASVRQHGVVQPLVVRALAGGRYQIVTGERRWRAAELAGLETVPCIGRDATEQEMLAVALAENLQRADLNPIDCAHGYQRLIADFGLTQEEVAAVVGKSRPAVANTLRLLQLPEEVQHLVASERLSEGHGRALLALLDDTDQLLGLAREAVERGYSVREMEARTRSARRSPPAPRRARARPQDDSVELEDIRQRLQSALATAVRLRARGKGGVIEVEYYDADDLARIVEQIGA
jgi:ParB family chromosome partitioning protein